MKDSSEFLLTIGGILLLGLLISAVARRTFLPRVTLLLLFGILIGKEFLNLIPQVFSDRFDIIADMTLLMVGFLLGGKLSKEALRDYAGEILWLSISAALLTTLVVTLGLLWIGVSKEIAILLGSIASATAPAAVLDVTTETGIQNKFCRLLLSIVALDDIWALILFGIAVVMVRSFHHVDGNTFFLLIAGKEIGGAVLLGLLLGFPAAFLTGRIKQGQPTLTEALGIVFICGGLAIWLGVSYLIASMVMGAVVANVATHHEYPFHAIEGIEWPFMVIFFVLAGALLEISALKGIGLIGAVYIVCRAVGKYVGARVGGKIARSGRETRNWMGAALLPQAGVSIGMALVASNQFPEYRLVVLTVVISSNVVFEIIGPAFTRLAIHRSE
ncbi:MAG: cation:proton antiporter [Desulfobacteraceae bacterium]|jgi:Kef-type K+ transport system membrane component KefB